MIQNDFNGVQVVENPNSVVQNLVDKHLLMKSSFNLIMYLTGWSENELWLYIDMIFRKKYPNECDSDKTYYCWGFINDKQNTK